MPAIFNELRQRKVIKVTIAYGALAWLADLTAANASAVNVQGTWVAFRYARAGDAEYAIQLLLRAYEQADPNVIFLRMPEFEPLHSDPRIHELMVKLGIQ